MLHCHCGFEAHAEDEEELVAQVRRHAWKAHGMSLTEALGAALAALTATAASGSAAASNGAQPELTAANLEVAILDRARAHRTFRRLHGPRLEELIAQSRTADLR